MDSFMSWVGGKKALRDAIIDRFPLYYERYIEVFGGAGWVLFRKPPGLDMEVWNDRNSNLTNLYRCVREQPDLLKEKLRYCLNSREDFEILSELHRKQALSLFPDVERAAKFYQLIRLSYASGLESYAAQPHSFWHDFPQIDLASRRLQKVIIENRDFEKLLAHYDRESSFFYCDPPYFATESYAEAEYEDLARNLGGTYLDFMPGQYRINPLEPKDWNVDTDAVEDAPEAFQKATRLRQHISYLKDFFRAYKDFSDSEIDTIELMLLKLYTEFGLDDSTDFERVSPREYPIMQDLYDLIEHEYKHFDTVKKHLYTEEMLQNICLGLHSMCKGAESTYFNGHTNIRDGEFLCFGVKGLLDTNKRLKDTLLFNVLSYMSGQLLTKGNTVAAIDEAYLFLSNMTAIEYIRNAMKRVRKKDSAMMLASQNIDDFLIPEVKEFTKPLFAIPTHQFLFYAGNIEPRAYMDTLQLEQSEFRLIQHPARGLCLYRCGNERYLLQVKSPEYKEKLFGKAGGR